MTLIDHVTDAGALPSLAATIQFAAGRQSLIAGNIANLSTPGYRHRDVSPAEFRRVLGEAIEARRASGRSDGALTISGSRRIAAGADGSIGLRPETGQSRPGVLAQDHNNRDLERLMQDLTENLGAYRVATELMRAVGGTLRVAISERV